MRGSETWHRAPPLARQHLANTMEKQTPHLPDLLAAQIHALALDRHGMKMLLAVSGGADSMAMLHGFAHLAAKSGLQLHVAHLDHGIRSTGKDDETLVEATCRHYGLACTCGKVDVPDAARTSGLSIEIQARELRYAFFQDVYQTCQADALLTAHNRNDQAETILLHLARGCSPGSLAGMQLDTQRLGMRIVRPMLTIDRTEILDYLQAHDYIWNEDASNQDVQYRRNAVRHLILPALREHLNPNVDTALLRCAQMAQEDEHLLQSLAQETAASVHPPDAPQVILLHPFRQTPTPLRRRVLTQWLHQQGQLGQADVRHDTIQRIDHMALEGQAGNQITLPGNLRIRHIYDRLVLETIAPARKTTGTYPLPVPGTTTIPELGIQIEIREDTGYTLHPSHTPGTLPATCHIRPPRKGETLCVRTRQDGDQMQLLGSRGHSKLQDILTDTKVPVIERDQIPLLATQASLVWIPGMRISQAWAVGSQGAPSLSIHIRCLLTSNH